MYKINFKSIDPEQSCYCFASKKNMIKIESYGLVPQLSHNINGVENQPQTFFSKGEQATLYSFEVLIRWLIYKQQKSKLFDYVNKQGVTQKTLKNMILDFNIQFANGKYNTPANAIEAYKELQTIAKNNVMLQLILKDGEDYNSDIIKPFKHTFLINDIDFSTPDNNSSVIHNWNMHTRTNHIITPNKIKHIVCKRGEDMLDVIYMIHEKHKNSHLNTPLLDGFFDYINEQELCEQAEQNK